MLTVRRMGCNRPFRRHRRFLRFREAQGAAGLHGGENRSAPMADVMRKRPPRALIRKERLAMTERKNQCIHCCVESCKHLKKDQGICSLESIQVAPTPMAYSGDPADESMCQSYHSK